MTAYAPEALTIEPDYYEVIDGVGTEWPEMSTNSQMVGSRLFRKLGNHCEDGDFAECGVEVLFKLPGGRKRRPDMAVIPYSKWPKNKPWSDANGWDVVPDLCVEVVSPTDYAEDVREKVIEYFAAGVRGVWVVYPRIHVVDVFASPKRVESFTRADTLTGGDVLPGFALPLADLFPVATPEPAAAAGSGAQPQ